MLKKLKVIGAELSRKELQSISGSRNFTHEGEICSDGKECTTIADCTNCMGCYWHPNGVYKICR